MHIGWADRRTTLAHFLMFPYAVRIDTDFCFFFFFFSRILYVLSSSFIFVLLSCWGLVSSSFSSSLLFWWYCKYDHLYEMFIVMVNIFLTVRVNSLLHFDCVNNLIEWEENISEGSGQPMCETEKKNKKQKRMRGGER